MKFSSCGLMSSFWIHEDIFQVQSGLGHSKFLFGSLSKLLKPLSITFGFQQQTFIRGFTAMWENVVNISIRNSLNVCNDAHPATFSAARENLHVKYFTLSIWPQTITQYLTLSDCLIYLKLWFNGQTVLPSVYARHKCTPWCEKTKHLNHSLPLRNIFI